MNFLLKKDVRKFLKCKDSVVGDRDLLFPLFSTTHFDFDSFMDSNF